MASMEEIDLVAQIPLCAAHLTKVFNPARANQLLEHSKFDFDIKLTVDLVKINSPIYPLTLKE
ncbi:hypothetical protein DSO57_1022041 [Entomophthora muscae]|uniref:Uncharacterized protein n=1 Tax=Entomophthora muscae TaxID=34485 RepID=A0ACC2RHV0_9FUNG|nr:hypothetical protein DSO57_1022041 [Entomophthora muscae]